MNAERRWSFWFLCLLPFLSIALAGTRPLSELPGHAFIGIVLSIVALDCARRLVRSTAEPHATTARLPVLAGALLIGPWILIGLLWVGLGAPFQANATENQHRYVVLMVNALLVGGGFIVLRDALRGLDEGFFSSALIAAAIPASVLYLLCIAITLAQATMVVQGDRTTIPPTLSHLYDALEFFACVMTYVSTALAAAAMSQAGVLGRVAARVFVALCLCIIVLLALRGIEFPEISGQTAPWYSQPGVVLRIPAIPWVMPGILGVMLLRFAGTTARRARLDSADALNEGRRL
jgi:hypothetical protein